MPNQADIPTSSDPEQYDVTTLTRIRATDDSDVEAILAGRITDDPLEFAQSEFVDGKAMKVRRHYEPVAEIDLPEPMPLEDAITWLNDHRDHDALEDYDWEAHDRTDLLDAIVTRDASHQQFVASVFRRIEEIRPADIESQQQLDKLKSDLADVIADFDGTAIDKIDDEPEEADA